jgi:acylphosphatase
MAERTVKIIVKGRVQGVWFRAGTQITAHKLDIVGTVRNLPDHSVEIIAQGESSNIDSLINWSRRGVPFARVDSVDVSIEENKLNLTTFKILY